MVKPTIFTVSDEDAKKKAEKAAEAGFVEVPVDTVECTVKDPSPIGTDRRNRRACYITLGVVTTLLLIGAVVAIILVFVLKPGKHPENNGNDVLYPDDERYFDWRGNGRFPPGHRPGNDHDRRAGHHDDDDDDGPDHGRRTDYHKDARPRDDDDDRRDHDRRPGRRGDRPHPDHNPSPDRKR